MVCSAGRFVVCLAVCHFVLVFFSPFGVAVASLWEEGAGLGAFRAFVRFVLVWGLSVSSSSWCLGRAVVCDCGTPWTFLLPFFHIKWPNGYLKQKRCKQHTHSKMKYNKNKP